MPVNRYEFWRRRRQRERFGQLLWQFHSRRTRPTATAQPASIPAFTEIVSTENLARVAEMLKAAGPDKAPGPDEARFRDLSKSELWGICRDLSRELRAGAYQPSARRIVEIKKRDGGTRPLSIRSIVHRIVATALYHAIYPVVEPAFVPHSYGFVHGRSAWDMLLAIRRDVQAGSTVIAINDVRQAFDYVNLNFAMEDLSRHIVEPDLRNLVARILRGHPSDVREQADMGIDQGSALSPLVLNVLLHHRLDVPLAGVSDSAVHRYADNLCTVAATVLQVQERMRNVSQFLTRIGMNLKYPVTAIDLREAGRSPELLGYQPRLDQAGRLVFDLAGSSWESLGESLQEAFDEESPANHAGSVVLGWCEACGPVLETMRYDTVVDRIQSIAGGLGFRGISPESCRRALQASYGRWGSAGKAAHGVA